MSPTQTKLLVATDFSDSSKMALKLASWFADTFKADIDLLSVMEPHRSLLGLSDPTEDETQQRIAMDHLDAMIEESGKAGINKLVATGKPWKAILDTAQARGSAMIFMGTAGIYTMSEMFLGSNAGRIARMATCPVVTVRPGFTPSRPINRVLIPVDPSFGIRELRDFFAHHGSWRPSVDLLCVSTSKDDNRHKMEEHLAKQQEMFTRMGFTDVKSHIVPAVAVSSAILTYIENNKDKIDMVMMETKGRQGLQGWLIGSITEEVISFSPIPVLSLKPDRREDHTHYSGSNVPV